MQCGSHNITYPFTILISMFLSEIGPLHSSFYYSYHRNLFSSGWRNFPILWHRPIIIDNFSVTRPYKFYGLWCSNSRASCITRGSKPVIKLLFSAQHHQLFVHKYNNLKKIYQFTSDSVVLRQSLLLNQHKQYHLPTSQ